MVLNVADILCRSMRPFRYINYTAGQNANEIFKSGMFFEGWEPLNAYIQ